MNNLNIPNAIKNTALFTETDLAEGVGGATPLNISVSFGKFCFIR